MVKIYIGLKLSFFHISLWKRVLKTKNLYKNVVSPAAKLQVAGWANHGRKGQVMDVIFIYSLFIYFI